jgi:hypothetical protein
MHVGADSIRRLAVNFMPKGKTPDRRGLSGETAGDPKFSLPPSLSNTPTAGSQQRNQNQTRRNKVGEALRLLPLTDKETDLSPFISAFEMTYYAVIRRKNDQPASGPPCIRHRPFGIAGARQVMRLMSPEEGLTKIKGSTPCKAKFHWHQ